jgi:DNA-binding PadR family transcriptional regulator
MNRGDPLTELEQFVLLALLRLGDEAYGVSVRREIEDKTGRPISITAIYAALDRLEARGYVSSWVAEATAVRGGRAKKHFELEKAGARALNASRQAMKSMWAGLERHPSLKTR